jgi:adenylyltransferase/sulfurtransferase
MYNLYPRYQRQIILPEIGEAGQQKIAAAKVLVIGTGGLGCPALQYLAAAGIGAIGIVDDDIVSISNLHRQILFETNDVGLQKAAVASVKLSKLNPEISIKPFAVRITTDNAFSLIDDYDIVLDCTDNFASRYLINDACVLLKKPLVFGAISKFDGQVAIFNIKDNETEYPINYRDLFPQPPKADEIKNCAEAGVLGVLPGTIGTLMANETIKIITGIGIRLINKMLLLNLLNYQSNIFNIIHNSAAALLIPKNKDEFIKTDYAYLCGERKDFIIDKKQMKALIAKENILIVDVRELGEKPDITGFHTMQVPLSILADNFDKFDRETLILFCQSGARSLEAAMLLFDKFGTSKQIYSLQNGVSDLVN